MVAAPGGSPLQCGTRPGHPKNGRPGQGGGKKSARTQPINNEQEVNLNIHLNRLPSKLSMFIDKQKFITSTTHNKLLKLNSC